MHEEDLLAKKELLHLTGISYGQLYRWKRQNLIPEAWFIKQASFTGQETFFPKEKILTRVKMIMDLKDQYSLDELANLFAPESTDKVFKVDELDLIDGMAPNVLQSFSKVQATDTVTFKDAVLIYVLSKLSSQYVLKDEELQDLVISSTHWLPRLTNLAYRMVVCRREDQIFGLLLPPDAELQLDYKTVEQAVFDLEELAKELNLKLKQSLA
ncbi:MAG: DUF4004 family protein [Peptococcaceae bacterium]|nr:DUF4004 family protein [Peptococcaceae bacterium]